MNLWDPFNPIAYFLHTVLGVSGIIGAFVALSVTKGTTPHVMAGRVFGFAAAVAAGTAILFSFSNFAPMAIASSALTISAVGSAVLALRTRSARVTAGEIFAAALMALVLIWLLFGAVLAARQGGLLWIPPLVLAGMAACLLVSDILFLRQPDAGRRLQRIKRHLSRMSFALAIVIQAPIVVFADKLNIHPGLAFYGPLVLWPAIAIPMTVRLTKNLTVIADRRNPGPARH